MRRIINYLPACRQNMLFSATMPEDSQRLAEKILVDPVHIQIGAIAPVNTVSHALYPVTEKKKYDLLTTVLRQTPTGRVLTFTRTKRRARNLATYLMHSGYRVSALQGDMTQNRRQAAIEGFRKGKYDILIATDVAARGLDVSEISHVINFDMPDSPDSYTHRIGRTGRARHTGEAFSFATEIDGNLVRQIETLLGSPFERRSLPGFNSQVLSAAKNSGVKAAAARPVRRSFRPSLRDRRRRLRAH